MFNAILSSLRAVTSNDAMETKRRHPRRGNDRCVVVIQGQTFPVENWSLGGILIGADERLFGTTQDIAVTLKFKLRNTIIDIPHRGQIVRKGNGKVAVAFEPLDRTIRRAFQQVMDDANASEFASSQS